MEDDFASSHVDNYGCYTTSFLSGASVLEEVAAAVAVWGALESLASDDYGETPLLLLALKTIPSKSLHREFASAIAHRPIVGLLPS